MQGGGQLYGGAASGDYARRHVKEEVDSAQAARLARRRRARHGHGHGHFGWLHLGRRKHAAEH
jgi:hypothetical protein